MNHRISRRDALLAGLAAAIAAAGTGGFPAEVFAQSSVTADQFLTLSEKLTETRGLDAGVAQTLLGAFIATGNGPGLASLVAEDATFTSYTELANAIVAAWYSGVYTTNAQGDQAVSDFTGALVWNALAFTKPFAECGGETGYWAEPPAA